MVENSSHHANDPTLWKKALLLLLLLL